MQKKFDCIFHFCINSNFPQQIREKRNIRKKYKIMFCSSCGSLIIPNNGKYVCNVCGNEEKLKGENRITAKSTGKEMVFIKESSRVEPLDSDAVCLQESPLYLLDHFLYSFLVYVAGTGNFPEHIPQGRRKIFKYHSTPQYSLQRCPQSWHVYMAVSGSSADATVDFIFNVAPL